jgi:hypothetical protein
MLGAMTKRTFRLYPCVPSYILTRTISDDDEDNDEKKDQ